VPSRVAHLIARSLSEVRIFSDSSRKLSNSTMLFELLNEGVGGGEIIGEGVVVLMRGVVEAPLFFFAGAGVDLEGFSNLTSFLAILACIKAFALAFLLG